MKLLAIALNTFREAVRNKVFYTLLFFAVIFAGFSVAFSTMVLGYYTRMIIDMGLANIEIFGALIAIFVGVSLVYKELERRTIYTIIARPLPRWQFILGKYLGLLLVVAVEILFMSAVLFLIIALFGEANRIPALAVAIWLIAMKLALITAVAVFFSSISTPILSGMFTLAFYLIGNTSGYLEKLVAWDSAPWVGTSIRVLNFILPDFRFLDVKGLVVYEKTLEAAQIVGASMYALMYLAIVISLAVLIFDRKDMK